MDGMKSSSEERSELWTISQIRLESTCPSPNPKIPEATPTTRSERGILDDDVDDDNWWIDNFAESLGIGLRLISFDGIVSLWYLNRSWKCRGRGGGGWPGSDGRQQLVTRVTPWGSDAMDVTLQLLVRHEHDNVPRTYAKERRSKPKRQNTRSAVGYDHNRLDHWSSTAKFG